MRALAADRARLATENLLLRQQLIVLKRKAKRPQLDDGDRAFWVAVHRWIKDWKEHLVIVKPETVVRWHREEYRRFWKAVSLPKPGRPPLAADVIMEEIVSARQSPWPYPFVERVIGSIRRECTDHIVALGEGHLRRVLRAYADYYNGARCHQSLGRNAPEPREVESGRGPVMSVPHLGGLPPVHPRGLTARSNASPLECIRGPLCADRAAPTRGRGARMNCEGVASDSKQSFAQNRGAEEFSGGTGGRSATRWPAPSPSSRGLTANPIRPPRAQPGAVVRIPCRT